MKKKENDWDIKQGKQPMYKKRGPLEDHEDEFEGD